MRGTVDEAPITAGSINDASQSSLNALKLACASSPFAGFNPGGDMNAIPEVLREVVPETPTNFILNMIAVICGLGVVIAVCVATSGLDMSVGFF
jgi:hypothetical protein